MRHRNGSGLSASVTATRTCRVTALRSRRCSSGRTIADGDFAGPLTGRSLPRVLSAAKRMPETLENLLVWGRDPPWQAKTIQRSRSFVATALTCCQRSGTEHRDRSGRSARSLYGPTPRSSDTRTSVAVSSSGSNTSSTCLDLAPGTLLAAAISRTSESGAQPRGRNPERLDRTFDATVACHRTRRGPRVLARRTAGRPDPRPDDGHRRWRS